jgi:hypothetical protein
MSQKTSLALGEVQDSNPFQKPNQWTDVTFIVEGKKIHFNRVVLSMCSPVFNAMFTADLAEKYKDSVKLPGKKYAQIVEFFKHIHPIHAASSTVSGKTYILLNCLQ